MYRISVLQTDGLHHIKLGKWYTPLNITKNNIKHSLPQYHLERIEFHVVDQNRFVSNVPSLSHSVQSRTSFSHDFQHQFVSTNFLSLSNEPNIAVFLFFEFIQPSLLDKCFFARTSNLSSFKCMSSMYKLKNEVKLHL